MTVSYFEHYRRVNDLSAKGRRGHWKYLDKTVGPWLPPRLDEPLIVDIGCGAGILLEWLCERGYRRALGIDSDEGQVQFARSLGLNASLVTDASEWLRNQPRPNLVILKDVLEHIPREEATALISAIASRLAPDGQVYFAVPNASASFATRWRYIDATHLRSYTEHSIRADLEQAGLRVKSIKCDDVWAAGSLAGHMQHALRSVFRLWRRLEAMAEFGREGMRLPLGLNLLVIADGNEAEPDR